MAETITLTAPDTLIIHDSERGPPGPPGADGSDGTDGTGINVRGQFQLGNTYAPNDAVSFRSSGTPAVTSLYIQRTSVAASPALIEPQADPGRWIEVGAYEFGNLFGAIWEVLQIAHPFTRIGEPAAFYPSTGRYELADARQRERVGYAVVREVKGPDRVVLQSSGEIPNIDQQIIYPGSSTWQRGSIYYVSSVPGSLQLAMPSRDSYFDNPILVPTEQDPVTLDWRGVVLAWGIGNDTVPVPVVGAAPPTQPRAGDLWFRTTFAPGLYIYYDDGTNAYWVQTNG